MMNEKVNAASSYSENSNPAPSGRSGGWIRPRKLSFFNKEQYVGNLDAADATKLTGWVVDTSDVSKTVDIVVMLGAAPIAFAQTKIARADIESHVKKKGIKAGFSVALVESDVQEQVLRYLAREVNQDPKLTPSATPVTEERRIPLCVSVVPTSVSENTRGPTHFRLPEGFRAERTAHEWLDFFDIEISAVMSLISGATQQGLTPRMDLRPDSAALIAFYLPQFHPCPENDEWWGPGFTEWSSVTTLTPKFEGHVAPNLPADLGFYDLRLKETREQQAVLAKEYGIYGFCYYFYWFSGKRLLQRPIEKMLKERAPDLPFCLCWANEPWSRRWDGSESEVLMSQDHDVVGDLEIINDLMPYFEDDRYIRLDGRPLVIIYRLALMSEPHAFIEGLRQAAIARGLPGLYICSAMTFGAGDSRPYGCDAAVEFPPHGVAATEVDRKKIDVPNAFQGKIYDYRDLVGRILTRHDYEFPFFPGVMPRWDNTARKKENGHVFYGATPELFQLWLNAASNQTRRLNPEAPLVFINSWNEWGEGAHLEPDRRYGRRFLESVRAVATLDDSRLDESLLTLDVGDEIKAPSPIKKVERQQTAALENRILAERLRELRLLVAPDSVFEGFPEPVRRMKSIEVGGNSDIDVANGRLAPDGIRFYRDKGLHLRGWIVSDKKVGDPTDSFGYLLLVRLTDQKVYFAPVIDRNPRPDVARHFSLDANACNEAGFEIRLEMSSVERGVYVTRFIVVKERRAIQINTDFRVTVL